MRKQVIKIGDKFAARYKKWYHLKWRYIGINRVFTPDMYENYIETWDFILKDTEEEAYDSLNLNKKISVIYDKWFLWEHS